MLSGDWVIVRGQYTNDYSYSLGVLHALQDPQSNAGVVTLEISIIVSQAILVRSFLKKLNVIDSHLYRYGNAICFGIIAIFWLSSLHYSLQPHVCQSQVNRYLVSEQDYRVHAR